MSMIQQEDIEARIISIRGQNLLIDGDVAEIYGVETKRVNEAVKNNLDKFPDDYLIELTPAEKQELVENFDRFERLKHSSAPPKAFTEKGLYMLATILKSKQATQTTFAIIETFAKIRHLSRNLNALTVVKDEAEQKDLMQKSGEIIAEVLGDELTTTDTETTVELNVAFLKLKHTVKKKRGDHDS
jgi:hypothetical protein